jgi:hypothetical protein
LAVDQQFRVIFQRLGFIAQAFFVIASKPKSASKKGENPSQD